MRVAPRIILTAMERAKLQNLSVAGSSSQRVKERSAMIMLAYDGLENKEIADRLVQDPGTVGRWCSRYAQTGLVGILKIKLVPFAFRLLCRKSVRRLSS